MKLATHIFALFLVDTCLSQGWYFPDQLETTTIKAANRESAASAPSGKRISVQSKRRRACIKITNYIGLYAFYLIILECDEYKDLVAVITNIGSLRLWQKRSGVSALKEYECNPFAGLIVGGEKTRVGEFPHMAAIGFKTDDGSSRFNCGGSLISENFVLTVAHCYQDSDG